MKLSSAAIQRPVTVSMFTLGVLVFGYFSYSRLEINLMPELSYPSITIRTAYEGAAPQEVEGLVSIPIEEALAAVRNLTRLSSLSRAGTSEVLLELEWDTNLDNTIVDIRQKLDLIALPEEVSRPRILRYNPALDPIMRYGLYGAADLHELRQLAEEELKPQLERIPGVAAAKVQGGVEREILIELDKNKLIRYGIGADLVKQRLAQENVNLAGGTLKHGDADYLLRTTNEFRGLQEISGLILKQIAGANILLQDVATARIGFKDRKVITRIGGMESVEIAIYKEADANTVAVSRNVQRAAGRRTEESEIQGKNRSAGKQKKPASALGQPEERQKLADTLPGGIYLRLIQDQARFIENSIREVLDAAIYGGGLAILILYFFLGKLPATLIVALSIPISVVATFSLMYFGHVSVNIMSLGGLALGIGMLVDNAIVVLESIFRCREEGDSVTDAARRGTREVGTAVVASTLTTVAVFFPISFVKGVAGQIFTDQALTVTFSLMASLVVSLTLVPMLAALRLPSRLEGEKLWSANFARSALAWARGKLLPAGDASGRWSPFVVALLPVGFVVVLGQRLGAYVRFELWRPVKDLFFGFFRALFRPPRWLPGPRPARRALGALLFLPRLILHLAGALFGFTALLLGAVLTLLGHVAEIIVVLALGTVGGGIWVILQLCRALIWLPQKLFQAVLERLTSFYPAVLDLAMDRALGVIGLSLLLLWGSTLLWSRLGDELIPRMHQGEFSVSLERPVGTTLDETSRFAARLEGVAKEIPGIATTYTTVGISKEGSFAEAQERENEAIVNFYLDRAAAALAGLPLAALETRVVKKLRHLLLELPGIVTQLSFPSLFSFRTPLEIEVKGDDLDQLQRISVRLVKRLDEVAGLEDLRSNLEAGYPEIQIIFHRQKMASLGLDLRQVAQLVRDLVQGDVATRYNEGERKLDVRVRLRDKERRSIADLANLIVNPGVGRPIPLSAVATLEVGRGPSEIKRIDQSRVALLSANVSGVALGTLARKIQGILDSQSLPPGTTVEVSGQNREMQASFESLIFALALAVFLVYLVMASQFESFIQPLIVLFSIPLAAVGALAALYLLDTPVSIVVYIGMIVLVGIVVNNAIVLIDYANQCRQRGMNVRRAIQHAGQVRLRPILMTTATTVLGLIPMAIGIGEGAEMRVPLAVTLIAGLTSSSILTLVVIPTVYSLVVRDPEPQS